MKLIIQTNFQKIFEDTHHKYTKTTQWENFLAYRAIFFRIFSMLFVRIYMKRPKIEGLVGNNYYYIGGGYHTKSSI